MGTDKPIKTDSTTAGNKSKTASATPKKKKFKLHRMTKKELLETRIPVYDYLTLKLFSRYLCCQHTPIGLL